MHLSLPPTLCFPVAGLTTGVTKQSLQFLVAAGAFKESLAKESLATPDTADGKTSFDTFVAVVNKFIEDNSPFEVNIDSKTKREILSRSNRAGFQELSQVGALGNNQEGNTRFWLYTVILS